MEWWNGIVECVIQGERSLLMQFFTMVTPVEVCNHGSKGSELHKQMTNEIITCKGCYGYLLSSILHPSSLGLGIDGGSELFIALYPVPSLGHSLCMLISEMHYCPTTWPSAPCQLAPLSCYTLLCRPSFPSSGWTCRQLR